MPIRTLNIGPAPGEGREQGTHWHWLTDPSTDCARVLEGIKCHSHCREEEEDEEEKEEDHRGVTAAETLTVLKGKILGTLETKYWLWQPRRQLSFSFPTLLSIIAREDPISDKKPERFKAWLKTLHKPGSASSLTQLPSREVPVPSVPISLDPSSPPAAPQTWHLLNFPFSPEKGVLVPHLLFAPHSLAWKLWPWMDSARGL